MSNEYAIAFIEDVIDDRNVTLHADTLDEARDQANDLFPGRAVLVAPEAGDGLTDSREEAFRRAVDKATAAVSDDGDGGHEAGTGSDRTQIGISSPMNDDKPMPSHGSYTHAMLTIVDYANENGMGPVKSADTQDAYEAFGFTATGSTAAISALRDDFEAIAGVDVGGYPPAYVVTYRGAQILDELGRLEPDEETLKEVAERRGDDADE